TQHVGDYATMELNELQQIRLDKVNRMRERGINPYPNRAKRTHTNAEALELYGAAETAGTLAEDGTLDTPMTLVGRIVGFRHMGKTVFAHIEDGYARIQLYIRKDAVGDDLYADVLKLFDLGDFVQADGQLFRTRTGEVSLRVSSITMLSKALNAPPEKWHGLKDIETRYRQRYADLLANEEVRQVFRTRSRIVTAIRQFLDARASPGARTSSPPAATPRSDPPFCSRSTVARRHARSRPTTTRSTRPSTCASPTSSTSSACSRAASSVSTRSPRTSATRGSA